MSIEEKIKYIMLCYQGMHNLIRCKSFSRHFPDSLKHKFDYNRYDLIKPLLERASEDKLNNIVNSVRFLSAIPISEICIDGRYLPDTDEGVVILHFRGYWRITEDIDGFIVSSEGKVIKSFNRLHKALIFVRHWNLLKSNN